jgi:hypothetical protein
VVPGAGVVPSGDGVVPGAGVVDLLVVPLAVTI